MCVQYVVEYSPIFLALSQCVFEGAGSTLSSQTCSIFFRNSGAFLLQHSPVSVSSLSAENDVGSEGYKLVEKYSTSKIICPRIGYICTGDSVTC